MTVDHIFTVMYKEIVPLLVRAAIWGEPWRHFVSPNRKPIQVDKTSTVVVELSPTAISFRSRIW